MAEQQSSGACVIGRGITIKGSVAGAEALVVEGSLEGRVDLKSALTVAETGTVNADITAETLTVHGQVVGSIEASDVVSLAADAQVTADIRAPRVVIEDGARFKGSIDMDVDLPADL